MVPEQPHILPVDIKFLLDMLWEVCPSVDEHTDSVRGQPEIPWDVNVALILLRQFSHHVLAPMAA